MFLSNGSRSKTIDDFFKSLFSSYRYIGDGGKEFYKISPQKAARLLSRNAKLFGGEEVADEEVAKSEIDKSTGKLTLKVAYDGLTLPDTFRFKKGQATGEMKVESGMFKVYKAKFGDISPTVTSMQPKDIKVLREQFKKDGVATFTSPSRAATFIYGQNINGKTDWKNEDKKTLIAVIQERTAKGN
ncbi:MAG: DUF4357 domain-containing protein [Candidatus Nomurabacteria bacterium]|nr:DUF4357 domain-containing protein [Candidatus Nomurabacteria bacterium]